MVPVHNISPLSMQSGQAMNDLYFPRYRLQSSGNLRFVDFNCKKCQSGGTSSGLFASHMGVHLRVVSLALSATIPAQPYRMLVHIWATVMTAVHTRLCFSLRVHTLIDSHWINNTNILSFLWGLSFGRIFFTFVSFVSYFYVAWDYLLHQLQYQTFFQGQMI